MELLVAIFIHSKGKKEKNISLQDDYSRVIAMIKLTDLPYEARQVWYSFLTCFKIKKHSSIFSKRYFSMDRSVVLDILKNFLTSTVDKHCEIAIEYRFVRPVVCRRAKFLQSICE